MEAVNAVLVFRLNNKLCLFPRELTTYAMDTMHAPLLFREQRIQNVCHKHFAVFTFPWICSSGRHMFLHCRLTNFRACFVTGVGKDGLFRRKKEVTSSKIKTGYSFYRARRARQHLFLSYFVSNEITIICTRPLVPTNYHRCSLIIQGNFIRERERKSHERTRKLRYTVNYILQLSLNNTFNVQNHLFLVYILAYRIARL